MEGWPRRDWNHRKASVRTRVAVLASLVSVAAQGLGRVLTNILIGRMAGVEALGHAGTISAVAFGAALFGPGAFASALSKFVGRAQGEQDSREGRLATLLEGWSSCVSLGLALGVTLWAGLTLSWSDALPSGLLALGACLYPAARARSFLRDQAPRASQADVLLTLVSLAGTAGLALGGVTGSWLLFPQTVALLAYSTLFAGREIHLARLPGEILEFTLLAMVGSLASAGVLQLTVLIARMDGGVSSAAYATAAFAVSTPLSFVASAVISALYPALARAIGAGERDRAMQVARASALTLGRLMAPPFFMISYFAPELITTLWGADFTPAAQLVAPMTSAILATTMAAPTVAYMTAGDRTGMRKSATLSVAGTLVGLVPWTVAALSVGSQMHLIGWGYLLSMALTAFGSIVVAEGRALTQNLAATTAVTALTLCAPLVRGILSPSIGLYFGIALAAAATLWAGLEAQRLRSSL